MVRPIKLTQWSSHVCEIHPLRFVASETLNFFEQIVFQKPWAPEKDAETGFQEKKTQVSSSHPCSKAMSVLFLYHLGEHT